MDILIKNWILASKYEETVPKNFSKLDLDRMKVTKLQQLIHDWDHTNISRRASPALCSNLPTFVCVAEEAKDKRRTAVAVRLLSRVNNLALNLLISHSVTNGYLFLQNSLKLRISNKHLCPRSKPWNRTVLLRMYKGRRGRVVPLFN
jgi:hypothetical protein